MSKLQYDLLCVLGRHGRISLTKGALLRMQPPSATPVTPKPLEGPSLPNSDVCSCKKAHILMPDSDARSKADAYTDCVLLCQSTKGGHGPSTRLLHSPPRSLLLTLYRTLSHLSSDHLSHSPSLSTPLCSQLSTTLSACIPACSSQNSCASKDGASASLHSPVGLAPTVGIRSKCFSF